MKQLSIYFIWIPFLMLSQNKSNVESNLFKFNILNPGFTYERGLETSTSLCLDANFSFGFASKNNNTTFLAAPFLRGQYRYYYNLERRLSKGKSIANNSGGFLALSASYYFKPFGNDNYISYLDGTTLGGVWGFQKTYKSGINLSANTGLGYNLSNEQAHRVVPILNFTVGWVLWK